MKMSGTLCSAVAAVAMAVAGTSGCVVNPVTGKQQLSLTSAQEEVQIGDQQYPYSQQAEGGVYTLDPALNRYIAEVGRKLAEVSDRDLPYEFVVLNNSVPNAWALPGGKLAINRGLLLELEDEAQLAAVLGHEIVHAAARHGAQAKDRGMAASIGLNVLNIALSGSEWRNVAMQGAQLGAGAVVMKYSREQELESDRYGMQYMVKAGYDPQAAVELQQTFVRISRENGRGGGFLEGLFASHPPSEERVQANQQTAMGLPSGSRNREAYQQHIAGLLRDKPAYEAYDKGMKAMKAKRFDEAQQLADEAIRLQPREGQFYELRGLALLEQDQREAGLAALDQAVKANPQFFRFKLYRGLARMESGDREGARADLEDSYRLLPTKTAKQALQQLSMGGGLFGSDRGFSNNYDDMAAALRQQPERFLRAELNVDDSGRVYVSVGNRAQVDVQGVEVVIGRRMGDGLSNQRRLWLDGRIPPGSRSEWQATGIAVRSTAELRSLGAVVVQARPLQ